MKVETFVCNMLHENCFVVYDEDSREAAIIDPGFYADDEKRRLVRFVKDKGITIKYLLCTHLHFDHIFATTFVEDTFGVCISANMADMPWIEHFEQYVARFGIRVADVPRPIGHPLHEGDELRLGTCVLQCLATPGHSAGGMCFYAPAHHCLFAGDTLFLQSIGRTDFFDGDYAQLIASIQKKLLVLPPETVVYPGHGEPTTIGDEMMYNPFL